MKNFANNITSINLEEEVKKSYLDYAMSVIVGRALPDVRDGLKPVHRRILFAMHILGNNWNKNYKKSARIVGDVIGKYHPHGDSAVYETIVRMAQSFSLRYTLIDGQGNFGSIDGDPAAAMRYTEIRMTKIAHEILADLEKETVDFTLNYDETEKIPTIMPSKIPNLLINGSSGIAVGMATNIPPHNLNEIINGCLAYINNKNIDIKNLMKYIPGPDFPTSAIINGTDEIKQAYETGQGKINIRANVFLEKDKKNGKELIIINELPYQVNKSNLVSKIVELIKEKRLEGISALRDESDKEGMRIVIEIKKDAISKIILNNLYSLTSLQTSFGINMVALYKGKPKLMSLKEILKYFIDHRREIIIRRTNFELLKIKERLHTLEALMITLLNIDKIILLINNSSNTNNAKKKLISYQWDLKNTLKKQKNHCTLLEEISNFKEKTSYYYFTEKQAQSILDLKLNKLTNLEQEKLFDEYKYLKDKTNILKNILNNESTLTSLISTELQEIKNKFGDDRKTKIIKKKNDINNEDLINKEDVVVTLSYQGYVKYQPLKDYEAQHRGGKGKLAVKIKEKDYINSLLIANTHDTILCFSSNGRLYWIKLHQLPSASRISRGKPIINLLPLSKNERITAILPIHHYSKKHNILMATKNGIVKKTSLNEFSKPRNSGIIAINLRKNDELIGVSLTNGSDEVMLFSSYGKVIRFSEKLVRSTGRSAYGIKGIKLVENDYVVSLIIPNKNKLILTLTQNGYGKCTKINKYPAKSRATQGVISIKVTERNGPVVGAIQVIEKDQILIITNLGTLVRIRASEVSIVGRNTQGVVLIRSSKNEKVVALQRVINTN